MPRHAACCLLLLLGLWIVWDWPGADDTLAGFAFYVRSRGDAYDATPVYIVPKTDPLTLEIDCRELNLHGPGPWVAVIRGMDTKGKLGLASNEISFRWHETDGCIDLDAHRPRQRLSISRE